jgi:hypothetical protein
MIKKTFSKELHVEFPDIGSFSNCSSWLMTSFYAEYYVVEDID